MRNDPLGGTLGPRFRLICLLFGALGLMSKAWAAVPAACPLVESRPLPGARADVAALLLAGQEGGPLRAIPQVLPREATAGRASGVDFWIELDGEGLLPTEEGGSVRLELYAYAVDRGGELVATVSRWVRLRAEDFARAEVASGGTPGVKLAAHLDLLPA